MSTPRADDSPYDVAPGWQCFDLTPEMIAPMLDRFIRHFEPGAPDECWLWRGPRIPATGYGKLSRSSYYTENQHILAHRISWVAFTGEPILDRLTIDHTCNTRLCVNPGHLEPVTLRENIRRKNERAGNLSREQGAERVACARCGKRTSRRYMPRHVLRIHAADEVA